MRETVDFTILTCTYNRSADLADLLDSALRQQTNGEFTYEVVVVDNNSTDDTRRVVEQFASKAGGKIRYFFEPTQGKSYALNTGLREMRGRYYAIADDDLVFPETYVATALQAFCDNADVSFIGGKVLPKWSRPQPSWLTSKHLVALAMTNYGDEPFYANGTNLICLLAGIFKAEDVRAVGGYDVQLGVSKGVIGGVEDVNIYYRLFHAGKRGLYVPELFLYHKVEPERLTKAYHRRWHTGHGRQIAMLRDPTVETGRRIFDVPGHLYREALRQGIAWVKEMLKGDSDAAFYHETQLRYFSGFFRQRWSDSRQ